MNDRFLQELTDRLYKIGTALGFRKLRIRTNDRTTEIYLVNNHALQVEVDWRENNLFMYAVYLKDNTLPDKSVIYRYKDGQWCREFLEELYKTKRPPVKDKQRRYTEAYLFDCLTFYEKLIYSNPSILTSFDCTGNADAGQ